MTDVVEHSDVPCIAREPSMFIRDVVELLESYRNVLNHRRLLKDVLSQQLCSSPLRGQAPSQVSQQQHTFTPLCYSALLSSTATQHTDLQFMGALARHHIHTLLCLMFV